MPRLFHFSDEADIAEFVPRPVRIPVTRRAGQDWLNGPLVWAIDAWHAPLYLFPRECPRILIWPVARTTEEDRHRWFGAGSRRMIAFIARDWQARFETHRLWRYELPGEHFEDIGDAGMHVSRQRAQPVRADLLGSLSAELEAENVELRVLDSLNSLKSIWDTTLHASGIRLRNAPDWGDPGWPHSPPP